MKSYNAGLCDCVQPFKDCWPDMEQFVNAIKYVEYIRTAIPRESTKAPGRLRDKFAFLVKELETVVPGASEDTTRKIQNLTDMAVTEIDRVRDEMMKAKTKYVPHNLDLQLTRTVDDIQLILMEGARAEVSDCLCPE